MTLVKMESGTPLSWVHADLGLCYVYGIHNPGVIYEIELFK